MVEGDEPCDDGNQVDGDGCTMECVKDALFVFATSSIYSSDFKSAVAADELCTEVAKQGKVPPSTYIAWLSDATSPLTRMKDNSSLPYVRPDLVPVAINLLDLLDTELLAPIEIDETGTMIPVHGSGCRDPKDLAWTATAAGGMQLENTCQEWTSQKFMEMVAVGSIHSTNGSWSVVCNQPCDGKSHLYCIEQP